MKILLVEDNYIQLVALKKSISEILPDCEIDTAQTYDEAVKFIDHCSDYNVFFLDIALSEDKNAPNGMVLGLYIRKQRSYISTPIIFTTSYGNMINDAINHIHCYSFLTKPYNNFDIEKALNDILDSPAEPKYIKIKNPEGVTFKVNPAEVYCIVAENHSIYFETELFRYQTRLYSLDSIISELPDYFVRCHRKYIVNVNYINNYDKTTLFIGVNNSTIPVGRKFKTTLESKVLNK